MNCQVCNKPDEQKAMCFVGEKWCSETHRKILEGDIYISPEKNTQDNEKSVVE